jgi:hypothetical protein
MIYRLFLAAAASLWLALPALSQSLVMPGERAAAPKAAPEARLRLGTDAPAATAAQLAPLSEGEIEAVRARNRGGSKAVPLEAQQRRVTIGLARAIPSAPITAAAMRWIEVPGGHAARAAITSPEAGSLRLALELAGVPEDVEMVFFGSGAARLEGPVKVGDIADRTHAWWSPLTEGATQTVEFFVPQAHEPRGLALAVTAASHVFTSPSTGLGKRLQDIGTAGSCNVDLPCSSLASSTAFRNTADSVAQMVFHDAGFTILCTGTLLADGDATTQTPWFYSANHCFENEDPPYKTAAQMQTGRQHPHDALALRGERVQLARGALRLDAVGWRRHVHLQQPAERRALRAPELGAARERVLRRMGRESRRERHRAHLDPPSPGRSQEGHPGLGGALLHARGGQRRGLVHRGALELGHDRGRQQRRRALDHLGRPVLLPWRPLGRSGRVLLPLGNRPVLALRPGLSAARRLSRLGRGPAIDYTDLWWNPNESGWGLNLVQHPSRVIFGVWYTYEQDGTRTWYVMPGGAWTSATTYTGTLYATAGPPFDAPFKSDQVETRQVGTATLTFSNANSGTFAYSVDGVSGTKSITRQPF